MSNYDPGSWIDRIVDAAFGLLLAAIALAVAVSIFVHYIVPIATVGLLALGFAGWRAWQRSRW